MSLLLSVVALLATFYQLYLQRLHNEKSLKPLGQIVLEDRQQVLAVHLRNNGLGPLIIDRLTFIKDGQSYQAITDCLALDVRSYMHATTKDSVTRVVLPNSSLPIFDTRFEEHDHKAIMDEARTQLAPIRLKAEFRDIYDNQMTIERGFQWFTRYVDKI